MGGFMDRQFFKEMIIVYLCNHTKARERTAQAIAQGIPSKLQASEMEIILQELVGMGVLDCRKEQVASIASENGITVYAYEIKEA